jgi:hypothetical protein
MFQKHWCLKQKKGDEMKKKFTFSFLAGAIYITYIVSSIATEVGKPARMGSVIRWYHVVMIAIMFIAPFVAGYNARKEEGEIK